MKRAHRLAAAFVLSLMAAVSSVRAANDQFGVSKLYPTVAGGTQWYSKWNAARSFTGVDPQDPWFDAAHGDASYKVDGSGVFKITGPTPRMYIHDPAKVQQWRDVEMTVYAMRVSDDGTPYAGIVGIARTNHGTTGPELANLCDTRGYGARLRYDGSVDFDKETSHPSATSVSTKPLFSGGLPKNKWIGYKHVVYDLPGGNIMLEVWVDLTDGANGGQWTKVDSFEDNGKNFGVGSPACKAGVDPALKLANGERAGSESGKPNVSVYWRSTNVGADGLVYKKMSVREITATPQQPPAVSNIVASALTQSGAAISWLTDKISHGLVEYGVTASYGSSSAQTAATGTSHAVALTGLASGTVYHYRVKSLDDATALTGTSTDYTFMTPAAPMPPVARGISARPSLMGAVVEWTTDVVSHSQVEFGLTAGYGSMSYESTVTGLYHGIPLSGLQAGALYHYRVRSKDLAGLVGVSADMTFATTGAPPPASNAISAVQATSLTATGVTIEWTTTAVSHSQVEFGRTSAYGAQSYLSNATGLYHGVPLGGLQAGTLYHYRVKSLDAKGATAVSGDYTFTTPSASTTGR